MTPGPHARPAVALSSFDFPDAHDLLLHACEDCACPIGAEHALPAPDRAAGTDVRTWVAGAQVVEMSLDPDHTLLFNPVGQGGVLVVDGEALGIFRSFRRPVRPGELATATRARAGEVERIFGRLHQLEMIHPAGETQQPRFAGSEVLTAWMHVTNACNLRCPYCYVAKSAERMDENVGHAAVDAVVRSAVDSGLKAVKLKYAGGEASLNHHVLMDLHRYAKTVTAAHGLRLEATVLSNGVALPRPLVEFLKAEQIGLMISLDGLGEQHDAQRPTVTGQPSFDRVERTLRRLKEQDLEPHLSITLTNRNAEGLPDVVRFALERELTFSLNFFRDNEAAARFPDLQYQEQQMISALLAAYNVIEEQLPRWSVLGSILDRGQLLQPRQRSCGVGDDYVVIDQRGQVAKCHMEIERTLGDVFRDDPLQLVRNDTTTALNVLSDEKEGCRDCSWRYWCTGGCTVATFRATGRYDIKSPNCNIYKAIYPRALRLEGLRLLRYASR